MIEKINTNAACKSSSYGNAIEKIGALPKAIQGMIKNALEDKTMTVLNLSRSGLDTESILVIAFLLRFTGIISLDVSDNCIDDVGARALAESHTLTSLNMSGNSLSVDVKKDINLMLEKNRARRRLVDLTWQSAIVMSCEHGVY